MSPPNLATFDAQDRFDDVVPVPRDSERRKIGEGKAKAKPASVPIAQHARSLVVSAYRAVGFVMLSAILLGLVSYVATHVFYVFNRGWVAPHILTPSDPQTLAFASRMVEASAKKNTLLVERADLEVRQRDAQRTIALEQAFQQATLVAMRADLADRRAELARVRGMLADYTKARSSMETASQAFRDSSQGKLEKELAAGVIDKDRMLAGSLQIVQVADAELALGAQTVDLQGRLATLARAVDSLDAASTPAAGAIGTFEIVKLRAEYDRSVALAAKAADEQDAAKKNIASIDASLAAVNRILDTLERSPYAGVEKPTTFAFVPYDNAANAKEGADVYACRAGIVWCRRVGRLGKVAEGEVSGKHPLLRHEIRGHLVRLDLDDGAAAEGDVLHVGRKPLFF